MIYSSQFPYPASFQHRQHPVIRLIVKSSGNFRGKHNSQEPPRKCNLLVIYIQKYTWVELAILIKKALIVISIFGGSHEKLPGWEAA
jgi:hypothetical protein